MTLLKQIGGSNALFTKAPSSNASFNGSIEQSMVEPAELVNVFTYPVDGCASPNPDSTESLIDLSISRINLS